MSDPERSREVVHPGETDIAAPGVPLLLRLGRQIGRAAVALTGAAFVLMTCRGIIGALVRLVTKGHLGSSTILALIVFIGAGIGGVSMIRWAFRQGHGLPGGARRQLGGAPLSGVPVQQLLLAVASEHGGRVTAAEVAAALTIEPTYALRMLDDATQTGDARVLFSSEGIAIYEFVGLLASKDEAREPWQLVDPGETNVAAPAAPPPLGLGRQIGRAAVALTGAGFVLMTATGIIGVLMELVTNGHLASDSAFILFGSGIGAVSMVRWAFRLEHGPTDGARRQLGGAPPSALPVQQLLLAVAREHGGRVTAAEVAAAMAIEPTHALRMLDEATQIGDARVLFSPEGIAVYEFAGLLASKADAKESWQL